MEHDIFYLKECGNLLESLLDNNKTIYLIRVYGYESKVGDAYYYQREEYMETQEEKDLLDVLKNIRKEVNKLGWNDNKIVCEIRVAYWRVFVGFWDENITIGGSVIPNLYPAKYKKGTWGIEEIIIREGEK